MIPLSMIVSEAAVIKLVLVLVGGVNVNVLMRYDIPPLTSYVLNTIFPGISLLRVSTILVMVMVAAVLAIIVDPALMINNLVLLISLMQLVVVPLTTQLTAPEYACCVLTLLVLDNYTAIVSVVASATGVVIENE